MKKINNLIILVKIKINICKEKEDNILIYILIFNINVIQTPIIIINVHS